MIRRMSRLATAMLLTILLVAASEGAHAHAVLVESTPVDGAILDRAPDRAILRFNEPVRVISLRLVDEGGQVTVLAQGPQSTPDRVEAPLPSLSPGSYVVSWRLLSVDGHPVGGSVFFTLGRGQRHVDPGAMARVAEMPAGLQMAHLVARALTYAGALLAAGLALFLVLFGRHAAVDHRAIARPGIAAALLGAVATVIGAAVQAAMLAGGLADALESHDALKSSRNGIRSRCPGAPGGPHRPPGRAGPAEFHPNAGCRGRAHGRGVIRVHRPHGPSRIRRCSRPCSSSTFWRSPSGRGRSFL